MKNWLIIFLWWLSSMLLSGCVATKKLHVMDVFTNCPAVFSPVISNATYQAQIDIGKQHRSGLLVFKTINDSTQRVVLLSETGFQFFTFEFVGIHGHVKYVMPAMNKKKVVQTLLGNLRLLATAPSENQAREEVRNGSAITFIFREAKPALYYHASEKCNRIEKIEEGAKRTAVFNYDAQKNPLTIQLHQPKIGLSVQLKRLD